jgi:hypothetical protein
MTDSRQACDEAQRRADRHGDQELWLVFGDRHDAGSGFYACVPSGAGLPAWQRPGALGHAHLVDYFYRSGGR